MKTITAIFHPKAKLLLALGLALSLISCNRTEPESDALVLTFTQRDSLNQEVGALGTYIIKPTRKLSMQGALKTPLSIEGYNGVVDAARLGGDSDREVIVFTIIKCSESDDGYMEANAMIARVREEGIQADPSGVVPQNPCPGTSYAFFIEGIGDPPDTLVEIVLVGTEATQRLVVDPAHHTLPFRDIFQLRSKEIQTLTDPPSARHLEAKFGSESGTNEVRRYPGLLPLYVWHLNNSASAGFGNVGLSAGVGYLPPMPEFEFSLFLIEW